MLTDTKYFPYTQTGFIKLKIAYVLIPGRYTCPILHRAVRYDADFSRHQLDPAHFVRNYLHLSTGIAVLLSEV